MTPLWPIIRPHLFWIILGSVVLFGFRSWMAEHDARLLAESGVKALQAETAELKQRIATRDTVADKQAQVIVREVVAAKTPAEQIAEINKLAQNPVHAEPVLEDPSKVQLDLAPMLAEESECRQNAIRLGACQQDIADHLQIEMKQDKQVDLLKKRPSFWHRVADTAKKVAIGVGVGVVTAVVIKGKL